MHVPLKSDFLIIGSGIAGLSAALKAAELGSVVVITKKTAWDCNTAWAQGGIACVMDDDDSFDAHVKDTLIAGAGLCKEDVVRRIVEAAPARIRDLMDLGVRFTRRSEIPEREGELDPDQDPFDLGREGGHTHRRVLHCGDITGTEVIRVLLDCCQKHPRIRLLEGFQAVDLIGSGTLGWEGPNRCLGAYVLETATLQIHSFLARIVILATGGAGRAYLYTTNPPIACGEGVAMAYRAGAEIANLEFYQFHPTLLYDRQSRSFLISEALRGEGAVLKAKRGDRYVEFMSEYHPQGSLAPRDIVARAIDQELKRHGQPCVYLDITHRKDHFLRRRFPNIFGTCLKSGINMARDLIPVVPAAHYCCGGVRTDVCGRTNVANLYAVGEVGCTGLHGANRLASNSLLEGLAVAHNAVLDARDQLAVTDSGHLEPGHPGQQVPAWQSGHAVNADELIVIYHNWDEIRHFMWDFVGIFRTDKRLERAKARSHMLRKEIETNFWDGHLAPESVELYNLSCVAEMIVDCALARRESIGLHFNADCPPGNPATAPRETVLRRPGF